MTAIVAGLAIRRACARDAAALAAFGLRTFQATFGADNTAEDLAAYLERTYGEPQQRAEIEDPEAATLLAEGADGSLIGFAQIRRELPPDGVFGAAPVELRRFYVDDPFHGRGLAQILMRVVEDAATELGGRTLWLGVWERNSRAIAFYTKCGFIDTCKRVFVLGSDSQTDQVMVKSLEPAR
jgi:diamine N-acetyltransferase